VDRVDRYEWRSLIQITRRCSAVESNGNGRKRARRERSVPSRHREESKMKMWIEPQISLRPLYDHDDCALSPRNAVLVERPSYQPSTVSTKSSGSRTVA
jgi:hypothetical protein